jgi:hypothetical protein
MAATETDTQDDIDKIMSEIEELQQEMDAVTPESKSPSPILSEDVVKGIAAGLQASKAMAPVPEKEADPSSLDASLNEDEKDILKEFSGEGEEPWLEETLAHLKGEEAEQSLDSIAEELEAAKGLDDISSDAEELERELAAEEELAQELIQSEKSTPKPPHTFPKKSNKEVKKMSSSDQHGSLSMAVKGDMTLSLDYEDGTQQIEISFNDGITSVRFANGVEFKVPFKTGAE